MEPRRVYKCNIVGDDQEEISKLLSDPMFSSKIINPYANVGVIKTDEFVVQVEVVSNKRYNSEKQQSTPDQDPIPTFKLGETTVSNLSSHVNKLKFSTDES